MSVSSVLRNRTLYTPEQRQEAINLVLDKQLSCNQAGQQLGIPASCISRWVRLANEAALNDVASGYSGPALSPEQQRIRDLEAKVRELERDNDLLKKRQPSLPETSSEV